MLASMLENMHLIVQEIAAPFEPETGAYSEESKDAHAHAHAHAHDHKHHGHQAHG